MGFKDLFQKRRTFGKQTHRVNLGFEQTNQVPLNIENEDVENEVSQEIIDYYAKEYWNLPLEYTFYEVFGIFERMLIQNAYDNMILAVELARTIIFQNFDENYSVYTEASALQQELMAVLFVISQKFNFDFVTIANELIYSPYLYERRDGDIIAKTLPWSFGSFSAICDFSSECMIPKKKAQEIITEIWRKDSNFKIFLDNATEYDISYLKYADEEWNLLDWETYLYFNYPNIASWDFIDTRLTVIIAKYFPKNMAKSFRQVLFNKLDAYKASTTISELAYESQFNDLVDFLQLMSDYERYEGIEFDLKYCWEDIIDLIWVKGDGVLLTFISDILCEFFGVEESDMQKYIIEHTLEDFEFSSNSVAKKTKILNYFTNPVVFETIKLVDYAMIEIFNA